MLRNLTGKPLAIYRLAENRVLQTYELMFFLSIDTDYKQVKQSFNSAGTIEHGNSNIQVFVEETDEQEVPPPEPGVFYIIESVSLRDKLNRLDVLTPGKLISDPINGIVGYLGLHGCNFNRTM